MKPIISVRDLSKRYKLGLVNARTLREEVEGFFARFGRRKAGAAVGISRSSGNSSLVTSHSSHAEQSSDFWALRDVSFDVQPGEVVGIIGRNGAGKSTLLKILSRITEPTSGEARIRGRVASLLEVGTGFHPELTGRENIFLNGAILGMTKAEVRAKFDEIVAFAEVERFIDTPVKRYSSGMYVRLAFAVAAHLEPEILIVDEVLAVGDLEFQKKCLGKMKEVSSKDGRTVLFVSHNLSAVQNLCGRAIYLRQGRIERAGECFEVLRDYMSSSEDRPAGVVPPPGPEHAERAYAQTVHMEDSLGRPSAAFKLGEPWTLRARFRVVKPQSGFHAGIGIRRLGGGGVQSVWTQPADIAPGEYEASFVQERVHLAAGTYVLVLGLSEGDRSIQQFDAVQFDVLPESFNGDFVHVPAGAGVVVNSMERRVVRL